MTKLWDHLNLKNSFFSFFFYFLEELIYYRLRAQHFPNHLMESGTEKIKQMQHRANKSSVA